VQKLHNKDFQIAFKSGSDANKSKFAKECVHGELYLSDDALYIAESSASVNDSALSKFLPAFGDATIFSTEAALISSIAPAGTAAYASDTGRVYISNGSGWAYYNNSFSNNYSLDFDGTNDYLSVPTFNLLRYVEWSVVFWVKVDAFGRNLLGKSNNTSDYLYINSSGLLQLQNTILTNNALSTGVWTNIVLTRSSSNNIICYINGSVKVTTTFSSDLSFDQIGVYSTGSLHFDGLMDEAAIFNSALSNSDVSAIYNSGIPSDISSLSPVHWWRMGDNDGGTGTTITDQGSGGNDATLTNGPTFSTDTP